MRRRRLRPSVPDLFELWVQAISCYDPGWHEIMARIPLVGDDNLDMTAMAWLVWPGRTGWLAFAERRHR